MYISLSPKANKKKEKVVKSPFGIKGKMVWFFRITVFQDNIHKYKL